jgi:hypothetical protein
MFSNFPGGTRLQVVSVNGDILHVDDGKGKSGTVLRDDVARP